MLLLTIAALSLLACINYRFAKSFFYPGAVFCASWAGTLFLLWLAGDFFYPLSPETLFIVLCGGFALSLGSALPFLRQFPGLPIKPGPFPRPSRRILNWLVFVVLCGAPLALGWIIHLASQRQAGFFGAISFSLTDETTQDTIGYKLFGNLVLLALTGALIAFYERESGKKQAIVAMALGVGINVLTAGRVGVATLILGVLWLQWMKTRHINWKFLGVLSAVALIVFAGLAIALGKAGASTDVSLAENALPVAQGFVLYASGGVVAFDRVIREPNIIPHDWQVDRFFRQILNKFGAEFQVPWIHAKFVHVGPYSLAQNVYTIYFTFFDWGFLGMMLLIALTGFISAVYYRSAIAGNRIAIVFYSFLFYGLALSPYYDGLFIFVYSLIKLYAFCWVVYKFPLARAKLKALASKVVATEIAVDQT